MYGKTRLGFIKLVRTNTREKNLEKNVKMKGRAVGRNID